MNDSSIYIAAGFVAGCCCLATGQAHSDEPKTDDTHTIFGIVQEIRSGTPNVAVCLCEGDTGMPLAKETLEPTEWSIQSFGAADMAIVLTDRKGRFRFENVRKGTYRLVAQKWIGPYKGVFEKHGTVVQLMGSADNVVVPRPTDEYKARVVLTPPGKGIVQFDQDVPNSETFMLLSTSPPAFDPILGPYALGSSFLRNVVGANRMPYGQTMVIGAPDQPLYAFFFAADNSPGFAVVDVPASGSGLVRVPKVPFVAGWSDGRKTPPPKLAKLMEFLDQHSLTAPELLEIPSLSYATHEAYEKRMLELYQDLSREVKLPEGRSARVGDLLAANGYESLKKFLRQPPAKSPPPIDMGKAAAEVKEHYSAASAEGQEYVLWTARSFGRNGLWLNEDAFASLSKEESNKLVQELAAFLSEGEYGRQLCRALAKAGALKDERLVPGLMKVAGYHREDSDYDCRPKWMAVAALARQESDEAVPLLIGLGRVGRITQAASPKIKGEKVMNWLLSIDSAISGRICLTLLHSLWQVALLMIVAEAATRLLSLSSVEQGC